MGNAASSPNPEGYFTTMEEITARFAHLQLEMDPKKVSLKSPPKPYVGPDPKVVIPYQVYPHIIDNIITYAGKEALLVLRATCKDMCDRVDYEYAENIDVSSHGLDIKFTSHWLDRIPSFRFKGVFTIGVSNIPRGAKPVTQADFDELIEAYLPGGSVGSIWADLWLCVPRESLKWFMKFMKKVIVVDMVGANQLMLEPGSFEEKQDEDPRIFVERLPVKIIRMMPEMSGYYATAIPFTSPYVLHVVVLEDPARPVEDTWLRQTPYVPEGTKQLVLKVILHPDLPVYPSTFDGLRYPSTLKRLIIDLRLWPVEGSNGPSLQAFKTLGHIWIKVFQLFRPGIEIYIYNIHIFDCVQPVLATNTRDYIVSLFCSMYFNTEPGKTDMDKQWDLAFPHLKFLRGHYRFGDDDLVVGHVNPARRPVLKPDGTQCYGNLDCPGRYYPDGTPIVAEG